MPGKNIQTARKDFVTAVDVGKAEQRNVFKAPSLVCRRWFYPEFWAESPPGWLEQRPRWFCRAGSAAQGLLCAPRSLELPSTPISTDSSLCHLLSPAGIRGALPRAGRAGGSVSGSGVASAVTLSHTKGRRGTGTPGRGGCSAMASPVLAAGKGSGTGAAAPGRFPPAPDSGGGWKSRGKKGWSGRWPPVCPCAMLSLVPQSVTETY